MSILRGRGSQANLYPLFPREVDLVDSEYLYPNTDLHSRVLTSNSSPETWSTKDSGQKAQYPSGMRRDSADGKSRPDLFIASDVPYQSQYLTRIGGLLYRGAEKYGARNHEVADSPEELERMKASAYRHLIQWLAGETDEDHAAAVAVNIFMAESLQYRISSSEQSPDH